MGSNHFREYAVEIPSRLKCKFCGEESIGNGTSFVMHLAKIDAHGINICPSVSENVQKDAYSYATIGEIPSRKRVSFPDVECSSSKRQSIPITSGTQNDQAQNARNDEPVKTMGAPLLMMPTYRFDRYKEEIWSYLMDDDVLRVGIFGIGGVGKTELAKYVNNLLLREPNEFHHVFWVNSSPDGSVCTVSARCRVRKLQTLISKAVGVDLLDGDDEIKRAAQLFEVLTRKEKCVVILDDVCDYISLREVGVPLGADQCKVFITTRSFEVCRQFGCQRSIDIGLLSQSESYELYKKVLGKETILSEEGEIITKSIVGNCHGLPLAIIIMARNMRGITDIQEMRTALNGYMRKKADAEIFQQLKLNYHYLKDPALQQCFLCCPFFAMKNHKALLEFLVDEGIIKRMKSRREELDEAYTMVMRLQDMGLLFIDDDSKFIEMDHVIWNMALQIMGENQQRYMITLPDVESWTKDLVRVSLNTCQIKKIPLNYLPSCPELSTLLLNENTRLGYIGDYFFEGFPGLKFLSLSGTGIESLPLSVLGLVNLTTLILYGCYKLRKISSIAKLRALRKLDLCFSGVEEVPDGIEMLSKLKYLDLFGSKVKELKAEILANFCDLQFLRLPWSSVVKAEEIAYLSNLESLTCRFTNLVELNKYLIPLKAFKEREPPMQLCVQAGDYNSQLPDRTDLMHCLFADDLIFDEVYRCDYYLEEWSLLRLYKCNVDGLVDLHNNFQQIVLVKCEVARSFCDFSPIKNNAADLKSFYVTECDGTEFLFSLTLLENDILENLENIGLLKLKNFSGLFSKEGGVPVPLPQRTCFSRLKGFLIRDCPNIKQLFPLDLLSNLKNLEIVDVNNCVLMEEIFAMEEGEQINSSNLPKLRRFRLADLPKLKSICSVQLICDDLEQIDLLRCPKLEMDVVQVYRTTFARVHVHEM